LIISPYFISGFPLFKNSFWHTQKTETQAIAVISAQPQKSIPFLLPRPAGTINAAGGRCLSPLVASPARFLAVGSRWGQTKSRLSLVPLALALWTTRRRNFATRVWLPFPSSSRSVLAGQLVPSLPPLFHSSSGVERGAAFSGFSRRLPPSSSCVDCLRLARRQRHDSSRYDPMYLCGVSPFLVYISGGRLFRPWVGSNELTVNFASYR
jgi:hypothetical protein